MIKFMSLGEVCSDIVDCPHESPEWRSEGIAVIRNFNLVEGQIDMTEGFYVDEETYTRRTRRAVPSCGDIIFSREAPIGNCAIVPEGFKCCLGQRLVLLRVNHDVCSSEYLLAVLQSSYVKQQIDQVSKLGSIVSNFAIGDLKKLIVPVLDNQNEIAEFSDSIAQKLLNNKSVCADLEAMAKLLYDYWFVQFDFPDENGKPYKSNGGKMVWNEQLKREIPEGWIISNLEPYIKVIRGVSYNPDMISETPQAGYVPLVKSNNVQNDRLLLDDVIYVPQSVVSNDQYLTDNSIFVTMSSGSTEHVGKTAIISFDTPYCFGAFCSKIMVNPEYRCFVSMFFLSEYFKKHIRSIIVGTSIKNINNNHLIDNVIAIPPEHILQRFESILNPMFEKQGVLIQETQQLKAMRDFLLPMLMNGQVRV